MTYGDRITSARKAAGLTQEALARKADLALNTVQRLERGNFNPRVDTLTALATALDIPVADLIPAEATA